MMSDALSILIPAYNEAENLEAVIRESVATLQALTPNFDIVLIDDCSQDDSEKILQRLAQEIPQLQVIRNPVNIGCHPSTLVGFHAAKGDYRFFIPADRQIPASEITKFVAKAKEGCDVVYSWRIKRADPLHRRLVSGFYNLVLRAVFGIRIHDTDSASLLTRKGVETLMPIIRSDSAFITVEILIQAERLGLRIGEVIIDHLPRVAGVARGLNFKDISKVPFSFLKMLWWVWQQRR